MSFCRPSSEISQWERFSCTSGQHWLRRISNLGGETVIRLICQFLAKCSTKLHRNYILQFSATLPVATLRCKASKGDVKCGLKAHPAFKRSPDVWLLSSQVSQGQKKRTLPLAASFSASGPIAARSSFASPTAPAAASPAAPPPAANGVWLTKVLFVHVFPSDSTRAINRKKLQCNTSVSSYHVRTAVTLFTKW